MAERPTKYFSEKQEKMIANELGGYPVGLSGAGPANPGDVKTYDWLVECKTHTKPDQSIVFDVNVWKKIQDEAMAIHRKPVLVADDGSQSINRTWCMCRSNNVILTGLISTDLPVKVRKNVSCKHDKLSDGLKAATKGITASNSFFSGAVYELNFGNTDVVIMPFKLFKELFDN